MVETTSPRLGLTRWSASTDTPSRAEFDGNFGQIETNTAMFLQGTKAARPAASKSGRIYIVVGDATSTNNGQVYWDTGSTWITLAQVLLEALAIASANNQVPFKVQGASGQTANLQEWRDSTGAVVASIGPTGAANFTGSSYGGGTEFATLTVTGVSTFGDTMTAQSANFSGTMTANVIRSTAARLDGRAKVESKNDGTGRHDGLIPPGTIMMSAASAVPAEWLACNGGAVSRTTYPDLFAAIGTSYGSGDGSSTFNLPDLRDRLPLGAGTRTLGSNDGQAYGTARINRLTNSHGHSISGGGGHTHGGTVSSVSAGTPAGTMDQQGTHSHLVSVSTEGWHSHGGTNNASLPETNNTTATGSATRVTNGTHSHSMASDGGHSHTSTASGGALHAHTFSGQALATHTHTITTDSAPDHTHTGSTGTAAGVEPPHQAINYIIKW